ncbi:uncharacterized protein THITE_2107791 [Thermothielavioides terrestris NRRL 8126]|uniref:C2H2-type domain-containing protein n=1 Tax=Thermothielavioides terrestris (strain ATCC 38088 / NRRL 8126) TaxID=578455 RepID=G2QV77_THETT|nr:uncharacterized protein THITE_2107791 [Thermothielavioides terrestris NRRL 8126]AEO62964.1 hypothetical protein THITE_2107791 [Thermothielavioides terrestris NRRL 8126]
MGSPFQPRTSAFPSEPLASHQRRNSWDSTASTALDVLMSDDSSGVAPLETAQPPPAPAFFDLPSQQHNKPANSQSRTPIKRKNPKTHHHQQQQKQPQQHQQERVGCTHCGYFPDKGPDQRKKLARHELTDKHRRNTGQDAVGEAGRFPCPRCRTTFNRQDNLWQHVRKKHGRHRSVEGLRGRRKAAWRAMEQSPRLGVLLAEVPA